MSFGKKSSSPSTPQPVATPVAQEPTGPIQRAATNAEARDRVDKNASASLLAQDAAPQDTLQGAAGLMG